MQLLILGLHIFLSFLLILFVLLQHGKGADVGAAFGSGASNTMFGSSGAAPFLMKFTMILAVLFAITSIMLTRVVVHEKGHSMLHVPQSPASIPKAPESLSSDHQQNKKIGN